MTRVALLVFLVVCPINAQKKPISTLCTRDNAIDTAKQQILITRTFDNPLQTEAREMLNEVANTISKAPKTIVSARALLALAHLYAKVDMNRGVEELGNAVRTINTIESPDFSRQFVMMKIEGKGFL